MENAVYKRIQLNLDPNQGNLHADTQKTAVLLCHKEKNIRIAFWKKSRPEVIGEVLDSIKFRISTFPALR
jgi:hypothetical protein